MVTTAAEHALYWLAVNHPEVIKNALYNGGTAMLTENSQALRDVDRLLEEHENG